MTNEELMERLQHLEKIENGAYILKVKQNPSTEELQRFAQAWRKFKETAGLEATVLFLPDKYDIVNLKGTTFDFAVALKLLDMGYNVERENWTEGSIYKIGHVIKHSSGGKEWIPTQGAIRATNWRLAK